ncbi:MAG: hypothetical protein QM692_07625 [Thermomicrobiales bacterium]
MTLLDDARALVTAGSGSLGGALVRRLLRGELGRPEPIVVFSRDGAKQHDMRLALAYGAAKTDQVIYGRVPSALVSEEVATRSVKRGDSLAIRPMLPELESNTGGEPLPREYSSANAFPGLPEVRVTLEQARLLGKTAGATR